MEKCLHFDNGNFNFRFFFYDYDEPFYVQFHFQGKGYPDTNTRLILNKLRELHTLPIYALTDADPYGIEIMLTYRHGSLVNSALKSFFSHTHPIQMTEYSYRSLKFT